MPLPVPSAGHRPAGLDGPVTPEHPAGSWVPAGQLVLPGSCSGVSGEGKRGAAGQLCWEKQGQEDGEKQKAESDTSVTPVLRFCLARPFPPLMLLPDGCSEGEMLQKHRIWGHRLVFNFFCAVKLKLCVFRM